MSYPRSLASLTPREAITDALYRAIIGFDQNDIPSFESAFIGENVTFELDAGENEQMKVESLSIIRDVVLAQVGPMDTTHSISNVRVDIKDGADSASLTCNVLAQHCPPGKGKDPNGPKYLVAGEYSIDLLEDKTEGLWKIKKWVLKVIWRQGDASIIPKRG